MKKRILGILLILCIITITLPLTVLASGNSTVSLVVVGNNGTVTNEAGAYTTSMGIVWQDKLVNGNKLGTDTLLLEDKAPWGEPLEGVKAGYVVTANKGYYIKALYTDTESYKSNKPFSTDNYSNVVKNADGYITVCQFVWYAKPGTTAYFVFAPIPETIKNPDAFVAVSSSFNSIKLKWGAVNGASGYEIYRAVSHTGTYSLVYNGNATTYNNTGLVCGTTYYYKIRAYRLSGSTKTYSVYSDIVSARPIPSSPSGVKAIRVSSSKIKITWSAVSGISKYEVYRSTSRSGKYSLVKAANILTFTDTRLSTRKTYYYKVRSYCLVGLTKVYSNYSNVVYVKL